MVDHMFNTNTALIKPNVFIDADFKHKLTYRMVFIIMAEYNAFVNGCAILEPRIIANRYHLTDRAVRESIAELIDKGIIKRRVGYRRGYVFTSDSVKYVFVSQKAYKRFAQDVNKVDYNNEDNEEDELESGTDAVES